MEDFHVVRSALQNSIVYYVQIRMICKHIYISILFERVYKGERNLQYGTFLSCR